jgi:hypothetical protein
VSYVKRQLSPEQVAALVPISHETLYRHIYADKARGSDGCVVVDEGGDGCFKFPFEAVVFEQDAVLQGLVPALDLSFVWGCMGAPRTCFMPLRSRYSARSSAM